MRYAANLRTSRRHHILKLPYTSSVISLIGLSFILLALIFFVNLAKLDTHTLLVGFGWSLWRTTIAYLIALVIALIIAIAITTKTWIENIFLPIFDVLQSFPSFALFPVLVQTLRHSPEVVIIAVLTVTMIWPILFSIIGGIKNRREELEEAATIFGATGPKRLWFFTLPELMPTIVTGSIVGWGEGWEFIIGAELLVHASHGVGSYLGFLGEKQQTNLLFVGIVILMSLLFIINKIIWLPLLEKVTRYGSET